MASAQNSGTIASSTASSHSSGSRSSVYNGSGNQYGTIHRPTPSRSGSIAQNRIASNPADYVLPGVAPDSHILYAIAGARVYHSTQLTNNGSQWTYSHLKGTLAFGRDKRCTAPETATVEQIIAQNRGEGEEPNGEWWFQLVDDEAGKVAWKFKIPLNSGAKFNYELDRPFFHVFQGSSRKYGFLFDDDKEAATFLSEQLCVRSWICMNGNMTLNLGPTIAKSPKSRSRSLSTKSNKKHKLREPSSPPPSTLTISSPAPDSFRHVAHIGFNHTSGALETSKNLDPSFREILADLQMQTGSNVTESVVLEHLDFVQGFWKDIDTIQRSASSRPVVVN
ncbi:hypothetical protein P691DRAFT_658805 [Macrolepiota fuliginosa MF-IS2]|uniref:CRIB domain-containing protein n=1 Tax=Macrolepiota fuliginosa MF-IS2 TaxID=1400762 RepID=A0A9P5XKZ1_9AGAR|nr:hypothetical protein P691DRAFT_658805 [Macrolepiota fuliginosa MF-IS2]